MGRNAEILSDLDGIPCLDAANLQHPEKTSGQLFRDKRNRPILVIIRGIFLKGVGMDVLWPQYVALTFLGLAVFTAAVLRFHKRLD